MTSPSWPPQNLGPQPQVMYVPVPSNGSTSLDKINVNILLVAGMIGAVGYAAYAGATQLSDIKFTMTAMASKLDSVVGSMNDRITRVEEGIKSRTVNRYTRQDHDLWCARTENINKDWRCGALAGSEIPNSESYVKTDKDVGVSPAESFRVENQAAAEIPGWATSIKKGRGLP